MDTNVPVLPSFPPFLVGNLDVTPANHFVTGTWSADGRTLTCELSSPLPANTAINWTLNPANSAVPLTSSSDVALTTVSGSFKTGSSGGGGCDQTGLPPGWGNYSINKSGSYEQTSTADPLPAAESPFLFGAFVRSPSSGPTVTGGSVTIPDNTQHDLQGLGGSFFFSTNPPTAATLDAAYPDGSYTLRFAQTGQPERVIAMTMPAGIPVPKIANFPATQAVDAEQDFTLNWGAFTDANANDYISLVVSDDRGGVAFQAPDLCVPRNLPVSATSIVIPANTLKTNQTYMATLSFGRIFYFSTNAVPQMAGYGSIMRTTRFTIDTGAGGPGLPDPANLTGFRLLPDGNPEMDLTGTPTRSYSIERTGSLTTPNWTPVGSVGMDATGKGIFEDTQPNKTYPLFYRAVAN